MNGRASFDRLRDDIEAIKKDGTTHDLYRLRDLLFGEYTRLAEVMRLKGLKPEYPSDFQRV